MLVEVTTVSAAIANLPSVAQRRDCPGSALTLLLLHSSRSGDKRVAGPIHGLRHSCLARPDERRLVRSSATFGLSGRPRVRRRGRAATPVHPRRAGPGVVDACRASASGGELGELDATLAALDLLLEDYANALGVGLLLDHVGL